MNILKKLKVKAALSDPNSARAKWEEAKQNTEMTELRNKNADLRQQNHFLKHRCAALTHLSVCDYCKIFDCEYRPHKGDEEDGKGEFD